MDGPWLIADVEVVEIFAPGANDVLHVYRFIGRGASRDLDAWAFDRAVSRGDSGAYSLFKLSSMERSTLGGATAYRAGYVIQTPYLESTAIALLLFAHNDAYEIVGSAATDRWDELNEILTELVYSFQPLP